MASLLPPSPLNALQGPLSFSTIIYLFFFVELSFLFLFSGCIFSLQRRLKPGFHSVVSLAQSWCCCLTLSILASVLRKNCYRLPLKIGGQPHPNENHNMIMHHKKKSIFKVGVPRRNIDFLNNSMTVQFIDYSNAM